MRWMIVVACTLTGCGPIGSAVLGATSAVYGTHERNQLEKRIERLEREIAKPKDCLLLCDYPMRR